MAIDKLQIGKKEDNPTRIAQIAKAGLPAKQYLTAAESNAVVDKINEMIPEVNVGVSGFQGKIKISDIRTDIGFYFPEESGVYINADNINVDISEGINHLLFDGEKWDKIVVPFEANGRIIEGDKSAISGGEVFRNIIKDVTTKNKDIVSAEALINYNSTAFENKIHSDIVLDNSYTGKLEYYQQNYSFSGFGCFFTKQNPFDTLKIWIIENSRPDFKVTKLGYRICIGDEKGRVLSSGIQNLNLTKGQVVEVVISLDSLIDYEGNENLWLEFYTDGIVGICYGSDGVPIQSLKYVVNGNFKDFSLNGVQQLSKTTIDGIGVLFSKFNKVEAIPTQEFKQSIIHASKVFDKENQKDIVPAKTIEDYYLIDAIREISTLIPPVEGLIYKGKDYDRSTFSGWGQPIRKIKNFDTFSIVIDNWDKDFPITRVGFRICVGDYKGKVIVSQEKNINIIGKKENVYFSFPKINYEGSDDLWLEFYTDGACSFPLASESDIQRVLRYKMYTQSFGDFTKGNTPVTSEANYKQFFYELGVGDKKVTATKEFAASILNYDNTLFTDPSVLLNSKVFIYPGLDYNIYNKNVVVTEFGDNLHNYRLDFNGNLGVQFLRQYRLQKAVSDTISKITLDVLHGRNIISTHEQEIIIANINAGEGIVRNILGVGDSTLNAGTITKRIREVFNTDVMNVSFLGTRGTIGEKHEGRGGWTINDYYGIGRKLYVVPVSNIVTSPSIGSVYKQIAGNNFSVNEVNITNGEGYISLSMVSGSADLSKNGTLTKISGNGDNTINYSNSEITSQNPFYNPEIGKFDLAYYLQSTNQVLNDNDFVFFQLGINDVFGINTKEKAKTKVYEMLEQMKYIISNIHTYNSTLRIGLVITFPPANQDAFGFSYSLGQTSEMYMKTGLLEWQKALIDTYDNELSRNKNIYLVAAHLNLDTDYNYPTDSYTKILVHGVNNLPKEKDVYSLNGQKFTIKKVSIKEGVGFISTNSLNFNEKDGILEKVTGNGDAEIHFFSLSEISDNEKNKYHQVNGVHPSESGYNQIADMWCGLIKYKE